MISLTAKMKKKKVNKLQFIAACCTILLCVFTTTITHAKDYTFSWSANPEPVEGYKLYYKKGGAATVPLDGTAADQGPSPIDVGKNTTFTIAGLEDNTTYHFALTAYYGNVESALTEIITVFPNATDNPTPIILKISITPQIE